MMGNYSGFGGLGMIINLVFTAAVLVGLVLLVIWLVRRTSGNSNPSMSSISNSQNARDIAQSRYAKGEINREEYQQILVDLGR